jgi:hypothetical protein
MPNTASREALLHGNTVKHKRNPPDSTGGFFISWGTPKNKYARTDFILARIFFVFPSRAPLPCMERLEKSSPGMNPVSIFRGCFHIFYMDFILIFR